MDPQSWVAARLSARPTCVVFSLVLYTNTNVGLQHAPVRLAALLTITPATTAIASEGSTERITPPYSVYPRAMMMHAMAN